MSLLPGMSKCARYGVFTAHGRQEDAVLVIAPVGVDEDGGHIDPGEDFGVVEVLHSRKHHRKYRQMLGS